MLLPLSTAQVVRPKTAAVGAYPTINRVKSDTKTAGDRIKKYFFTIRTSFAIIQPTMTGKKIDNWQLEKNSLVKNFDFKNFLQAVHFVNQVAKVAESLQHHPDIEIHSYNKVRIRTTTHDAGTVTQKDYELAQLINNLL